MYFWNFKQQIQNFSSANNLKLYFVINVTKACIIQHNFVRDRDSYRFKDTISVTGF